MMEAAFFANPVERIFDQLAPTYESNRLSEWYKAHADMLLNALTRKQVRSILDIGCGTGWFLRQLLSGRENAKGVGIDISGEMIEVAKQKARSEKMDELVFIRADWEGMSLDEIKKSRVDTVVCANTFHYFAEPARAADRMHQVLQEDGLFFLLERDMSRSPITNMWNLMHKHLIKDHVQFYPSSKLIGFFVRAGFTDVSILCRVKKFFWKGKFYSSLVLISGRKQSAA
jgi:ubiquinone/menaquinone biosynthesis C-methylase UbiE